MILSIILTPVCCLCIQDGWTALMIACNNGQKEIAEFLIDRGADMNIQNKVIS
jgi:ankyrin repeat protein